ncbi:MAG: 1-deoxy-D-xylulose-5-phosphate synthase [Nitrospirae bacterium CG_4_10_14_3_um_filter_44_29]|nr:MAG: 1-deoxy-D-xylulose-5-phosphate synthase [Nitrospirae bacterium CG22_combo_CG10-13_8_21_14_all_44_11]PIV40751.1 MAG: 1-deoxy-D-xylulose-5-phosphate synthase [Nitrospirae bacterium CG02_land_8_20_14_3_00_44_33]PIW88597.1 MAG: 1-deoxy-D-xylulose-5-phosphate synthase [Nitrospirae bacterium CG_4_8_14_3_um_filter_44_28]PIX88760.1 MAG: 1-deoxy-D-xylulose-5-phosphate synthase [Nitrospirae bacterium CG_4_10_14_3_um_filter_44_29]PJA83238.1 MAG: 1-deoxy-D-xylulose-5-phosphate synthase [Nitrospirae
MPVENIKSPADVKSLSPAELKDLAEELREIIIERVSINGGHLASNLGTVELTLALHYVFNSPVDKIVWDVGHQSYTHKLITGRYEKFETIRKYKGISGFPKIDESVHDAFGTGHSSTSISAALGIIEARDLIKKFKIQNSKFKIPGKVLAVIGDGAMTSGLAFEGLNHAGQLKKDLIVVLNDNEMSISKNVGALAAYLNRILTGDLYQRFKKQTRAFLEGIPKLGTPVTKIAQKAEETLKGLFLPGILFEELGINYVGPIDGHDIKLLIETFGNIKNSTEPTLVHVITKKGKGYEFSEKNPCIFHGVGPFEIETGSSLSDAAAVSYSAIFGRALTELAAEDERLIAISAAMREGTGLECFEKRFPDRFYDVGIAEPHAVTFAAGIAAQGLRPVVAIYSTFLQRGYDEIIHDVCLQKLPVVFAIDRAGIVGEDGPTHQGVFDISYLRHIPNLTVMAPKDDLELKAMLELALKHNGPSAIRYPRGKVSQGSGVRGQGLEIDIGKAEILKEGFDLTLIAIGNVVYPALGAAERLEKEGIKASVINARFIKPLDKELILKMASKTKRIITIEENMIAGGFGSAVLEYLNSMDIPDIKIKILGIPDEFVEQGSQAILRKKYGIDEEGIYQACKAFFSTPATVR